ncbi:hypothetical protein CAUPRSCDRAFT_8723 [Caulochytrium protostelioides]|uniref:Uncharacterized protein n=1 Tax=Caulochytrium protostelioides TaxID=1555241 RepID=A0A4P9WWX4_9FUNG|nr:hypothetical protein CAUPRSCDRAFT_8723 [Caulochytrium protostelioides]
MLPTTLAGHLSLCAVVVEALVIISLEAAIAGIFLKYYEASGIIRDAGPQKGIPVYLIIFILAQVFQIVICWDALIHRNTIQMIGFGGVNVCIFIYSIFQYSQMITIVNAEVAHGPGPFDPASRDPLISSTDFALVRAGMLIAIPAITGFFMLLFSWLIYKLYLEFGWKIYKKIGADPVMRTMYRYYQIFLMLLKLDVFFVTGFGIQFLVLVIRTYDPEFALTIAALPIMMTILVLAVYGVRREDRWIMGLFFVGLLLAVAYFIFKILRIYTQVGKYKNINIYLTFFAAVSLAMVLATMAIAIICYRNFDKGLKPILLRSATSLSSTASDSRNRSVVDDDLPAAATPATDRKPLEGQ